MPRKTPRHLSAVDAETTAPEPPPEPKTLLERLSSNDELELLLAIRERVATALADPNTSSRDLAALSRRHLETAKSIAALKAEADKEAEEDAEAADEKFDSEAQ